MMEHDWFGMLDKQKVEKMVERMDKEREGILVGCDVGCIVV